MEFKMQYIEDLEQRQAGPVFCNLWISWSFKKGLYVILQVLPAISFERVCAGILLFVFFLTYFIIGNPAKLKKDLSQTVIPHDHLELHDKVWVKSRTWNIKGLDSVVCHHYDFFSYQLYFVKQHNTTRSKGCCLYGGYIQHCVRIRMHIYRLHLKHVAGYECEIW